MWPFRRGAREVDLNDVRLVVPANVTPVKVRVTMTEWKPTIPPDEETQ